MEISTIGIDLSKTTFHMIGLSARGEIVLRTKLSRKQLLTFTATRTPLLIGMEACAGAHYLARALREQAQAERRSSPNSPAALAGEPVLALRLGRWKAFSRTGNNLIAHRCIVE